MARVGNIYPAIFKKDEGGRLVVSFPDLKEAHTDGKDMAEASDEAQDCLGSAVVFRLADREEIPYRPGRNAGKGWCQRRFGSRRISLCSGPCGSAA